jgi:arylsulfatase A-like enzyme
MPADAPNVLLIVFDTARADAFEPYGAPAGSTPAFTQLAASGTAHAYAVAPASWTVPSHASLLSGRLPRDLGLTQVPGGVPQGCRGILEAVRERLLPAVLGGAGYETRAMSANGWVRQDSGFDIGFEEFVTLRHRFAPDYGRGPRQQLKWARYGLLARDDDGAGEAEECLARWLRTRDTARPFFWFANLVECHSPYLPPRPWCDLGPIGRIRAGMEAGRHLSATEIWRASLGHFSVHDGAIARMRRLYARSIRRLDDWLARTLEQMDGAGVLDDTLVVVTSDHGENIGEGSLMGHCFSLDERLIRIPLVMSGPRAPADQGVCSLASLPALIASAIDLDDHPWGSPPASGIAVAQFDGMVPRGDPRADEAAELWRLGPGGASRISASITAATNGRLKLVRDDDRRETVFDLASDPLETNPIPPARALELHGEALRALRDAIDGAEASAAEAPVAAAPDLDDIPAEEREALERQMRLLGYM